METKRFCSQCGLEMPSADPGTGCPHCLLRLALEPGPDESAVPFEPPPGLRSRFFADYEILGEISRGGMGMVWRARQLSLNRLVALKMIHAGHLASPEARLRFRVEVETIAQLNHPNIVPLYEAGEYDGTHFFTMRLVDGVDLARFLARAPHSVPLPVGWGEGERERGTAQKPRIKELIRLLVKICRAVHYAHQHGILHRDLKPSNILIDAEGEPHVADFGLAKTLARESGYTFTESILGSPNYMAPEQASGPSARLTTGADVYGLGAVLYEMLAGRPPFQAGTPLDTIRKVVEEEPISPRKINPAVDADLETVCLKCLQKNPAQRYGSAEELAQDLDRWLAGKTILARPVGRWEQVRRWCRREPALASALGVSVVLLFALAIGTAIAAVRISRVERRAAAHLSESLLNQARTLRLSSLMGNRAESLAQIRKAAALAGSAELRSQLRDELLAILARTDVTFVPQPQLPCSPDPALNLVTRSFDRMATITNGRTVVIASVPSGREVTRFDTGESPVQNLEAFSDDGRYLSLRHADGISIWDVEAGSLCFATNKADRAFCFVPGRPELILETEPRQAIVLELPSLRVLRHLDPHAGSARLTWTGLAISPDARMLAGCRSKSRIIELVDTETGQLLRALTNSSPITALAWSGDSLRLGAGTDNRRVAVWDIASAARILISRPMTSVPRALALDASAALLLTGGEDGVVRLFDENAARTAFELPCETHRVAFEKSGTRIGPVFRNQIAGWLNLDRPAEFFERAITDTNLRLNACRFSPDGRLIAIGAETNVLLYQPAKDAVLRDLIGWRASAMCFDPRDEFVFGAGTPGLFRWRLRWRDNGKIALDQQQKVFPGRGWRSFTFSARGDWFAAANIHSNAAFLFDRTFTNKLAEVGPHQGVGFVDVSSDGRWLATGSAMDRYLRVWDAKSGREVLSLPAGPRPSAMFSPDGKWLAVLGSGFELRAVGSWEVPRFPKPKHEPVQTGAAFSPDGRVLAVIADHSSVQLFDLATRQPLGLLQPPGYVQIAAIAFNADGTQLAAVGDAARLRIWDLRHIRQTLVKVGLDWEIPSFASR